jgi:hypothetical protein
MNETPSSRSPAAAATIGGVPAPPTGTRSGHIISTSRLDRTATHVTLACSSVSTHLGCHVLNAKTRLKMGANRAGTTGYDLPLILNQALGTKFDVISGYTGTSKIRVALQSREIDGFCSNWESMRVTARAMLDAAGDNKLIPFIINEKWEDKEVKGLPLFKDVIKDPKKFAIYKAWADQMDFQRPLALPPDTPKDRLEILRKALADTLKDKALLAEAEKTKLTITYVSGEKTEKLVDEILNMPADAKKSLTFLVRLGKKSEAQK